MMPRRTMSTRPSWAFPASGRRAAQGAAGPAGAGRGRAAGLVGDPARRRAVQLQSAGRAEVTGAAASGGRHQRPARRRGGRGLPVPRRVLRHRRARPSSGRRGRPALPRAGRVRPDHPHAGRPERSAAGRAAGHIRRLHRAQGGDQRGAGPRHAAGPLRHLPGAGVPGRNPTSTRPSSTPNWTWPGCAPGSRSTSTPGTSNRTRPTTSRRAPRTATSSTHRPSCASSSSATAPVPAGTAGPLGWPARPVSGQLRRGPSGG